MGKRGLFITFEGTEGSGKTTQAELLGEWLTKRDPVVVREPGGTELGEQIRDVLLYKGLEIDPEAEMYLFMASRRQLIAEVIAPALAARPDITFWLDGPVEAGLSRHAEAGKSKDRMERESIEFHRKVAEAYEKLAAAEPKRFVRLDATGSRDKIHFEVRDRLEPLLQGID
ncbi:MAG: thymidylate kinase [Chloroflexi bacterium]|nr:MAG: thymidylate kinase [Chloroflexota bacterium]